MRLPCRLASAASIAVVAAGLLSGRALTSAERPGSPLFDAAAPLEAEIDAPLAELFSKARRSPDASVTGTFSYADPETGRRVTVNDVRIQVRGNSSRRDSECQFPKMKLTFDGADRDRAPLLTAIATLKLGTHCDDRPDGHLTPAGRWANELAPWRETFVYRLLAVFDVPAPRARAIRMVYVDTSDKPVRLERQAMVVEDESDAAVRFGAQHDPIDRFTSAAEMFRDADAARLAFAEALIGNFDWCLRFTPDDRYRCDAEKPLWNIAAFPIADGLAVPIAYDFDLAGMVTGRHPWFDRVFTDAFTGSNDRARTEVIAQVQRTRTLFGRERLDATRAAFKSRAVEARALLAGAPLDPAGRRFAAAYLGAFFEAIGTDDGFYQPVVLEPGHRAWADSSRREPACAGSRTVPPGTPVGPIVAREHDMVRVPLLDALWHWTNRCAAIRQGPVWMDAVAIGRSFPDH